MCVLFACVHMKLSCVFYLLVYTGSSHMLSICLCTHEVVMYFCLLLYTVSCHLRSIWICSQNVAMCVSFVCVHRKYPCAVTAKSKIQKQIKNACKHSPKTLLTALYVYKMVVPGQVGQHCPGKTVGSPYRQSGYAHATEEHNISPVSEQKHVCGMNKESSEVFGIF